MNLTKEKEKLKQEIDLVDDASIIDAIKKILHGSDNQDITTDKPNEPLTDDEMALPGGRMASKNQIAEWLDREEGNEFLTGDEAIEYMRKRYEGLKSVKKDS